MSNKQTVFNYLDAVFNKRDLSKAETYWAEDMIQHNPSMPNGLDVLRGFITSSDISIKVIGSFANDASLRKTAGFFPMTGM